MHRRRAAVYSVLLQTSNTAATIAVRGTSIGQWLVARAESSLRRRRSGGWRCRAASGPVVGIAVTTRTAAVAVAVFASSDMIIALLYTSKLGSMSVGVWL